MEIKVELKGLEEIRKAIKDLRNLPRVKAEVGASALEIQTKAKRAIPVDTGHARNTTIAEFDLGGCGAEIGTVAPYAPYIEYGTRFKLAQPYLEPAYNDVMPKFQERLAEIYKK